MADMELSTTSKGEASGVKEVCSDDIEYNRSDRCQPPEGSGSQQTLDVGFIEMMRRWKERENPPKESRLTVPQRYINLSSVVNFSLIVLCSWEAFAVTFQFALFNGGPASMFYGCILVGFGATAVAVSLAELASMYALLNASVEK